MTESSSRRFIAPLGLNRMGTGSTVYRYLHFTVALTQNARSPIEKLPTMNRIPLPT